MRFWRFLTYSFLISSIYHISIHLWFVLLLAEFIKKRDWLLIFITKLRFDTVKYLYVKLDKIEVRERWSQGCSHQRLACVLKQFTKVSPFSFFVTKFRNFR